MDPVTLAAARAAMRDATGRRLDSFAVADALGVPRPLVPLGYRARTPFNSTGNIPATVQSNGTNLGSTHRVTDVAQVSGAGIVLAFSNFINGGQGEALNGNDYTITSCTIELGTDQKNIPVTFGGSRSIVVKDGQSVVSDVVGLAVRKGQRYSVRTVVSVANGQKYPLHWIGRGDPWGEGASSDLSVAGPGADLTGPTTVWVGQSGNKLNVRLFGPSAVLIRPTAPTPVLLALTDSIGVGTGESVTFTGALPASADRLDEGFIARAVRDRCPFFVAGLSGTRYADWNLAGGTGNTRRRNVIERMHVTHVLCEDGINDLQAGEGLASVQARAITAWSDRALWGRPIYQTTITPLATGTADNWTTVAGQTLHTNAAARVAYNAWLRDGAPMHLTGGAWVADAVGATGPGIARTRYLTNTGGGIGGTVTTVPGSGPAHLLSGVLEVSDAIESTRDSGRFAAAPGARVVTDGAASSGSAVLTSATAAFTDDDIGCPVVVAGAGTSGSSAARIIISRQSATQVTVDSNFLTTVSGASTRVRAFGTCADGVHPSGSPSAAGTSSVKGGHERMADFLAPILEVVLR
jgi:hypothetical protein